MWLGELADEKFLGGIIAKAEKGIWDKRLKGLLNLISGELGLPPTFHNVDEVTRRIRQPSMSPDAAIEALRSSGFKAVHTHFDPQGIRTDATAAQVENILKASLFEV